MTQPSISTTGNQPNPWLSLFLVIATCTVAFVLPGRWLDLNPLLLKAVGVLVIAIVFAIYIAIYGRVHLAFQHHGLLTVFMVASPWLFAAVNVWGKLVPAVLTTPAALKGLLYALTIGVSEELAFRGILFRSFQGRSMALYVLVSSITFGLFHYHQGYQGVMTTTVVGSSYSLARVAGTPLSLLIVCHAVTDFPNLFSHTPHPQYRILTFGAVVMVLALAVGFVSQKANWRSKGGGLLPSL